MAFVADVLLAAVLACASLFFGLVFTSHTLNMNEIINVLFAKSPDGSILELGPFFLGNAHDVFTNGGVRLFDSAGMGWEVVDHLFSASDGI